MSYLHPWNDEEGAFVRGNCPHPEVTAYWSDLSGDNPARGDDLAGPLLEPGREGWPVSFVCAQKAIECSNSIASQRDGHDEADQWKGANHWDIVPGMFDRRKSSASLGQSQHGL